MIIEIRKAGFVNKGAELMLYSVLAKMKDVYPKASFTMAPTVKNGTQPFHKFTALGIYPKASLWYRNIQWGVFATLLPRKIREMFGLVLEREVDVVLDVAGFAYSDQWGLSEIRELSKSCRRWKRTKTKIIMLPQAFGPFSSRKARNLMKTAAQNINLIFARDQVSYQHIVDAVGKEPRNIRVAPDFTNLTEGILPEDFDLANCRFCIVPNYRMMDKTPVQESKAYLPFMVECASYLQAKGKAPFFLVHEGENDLNLAKKIRENSGLNLPIIQENNPLKIKGILGACEGTIGSRYHGLVSALSQGVPSLGTGWSHKYKMLFEDYGFPEGLLDLPLEKDRICRKIDLVIEPESKEKIIATIKEKSEKLKVLSIQMWKKTIDLINMEDKYIL